MEALNLSVIAANIGGVIVAGLAMVGYLKKSIRAEAQAAVNDGAVSKAEYIENQKAMWNEINQIKKFDAEFGTIKATLAHQQSDISEIKSDVKGLSGEITGAITRVAEMTGRLSK